LAKVSTVKVAQKERKNVVKPGKMRENWGENKSSID